MESDPLIVSSSVSKKKSIIMFIAIALAIILLVSTIIVGIKLSSMSSDYDDLKNQKEKSESDYKNLNLRYEDLQKNYTDLEIKYDKQNGTTNDIFNTLQGLIANTSMSNTQIKKDDYKSVKSKLLSMKDFEDGTYSFIDQSKISYNKGYEVSFETRSRYYENYYTDDEYDNIVYKIAALLGTNADLGVFGKMPQISFYIENLDLALAVAAVFNQQSIWDWSKGEILVNVMHQPKYY